jgi:hypothetical protein
MAMAEKPGDHYSKNATGTAPLAKNTNEFNALK